MWSFGKRYRPLLGLDITTSSVKLIELAMTGGQYRVESYAAEPTPHNAINEKAIVDAEAVGEAIRRAVKRSGAKSREAAIPTPAATWRHRRRHHPSRSFAALTLRALRGETFLHARAQDGRRSQGYRQ